MDTDASVAILMSAAPANAIDLVCYEWSSAVEIFSTKISVSAAFKSKHTSLQFAEAGANTCDPTSEILPTNFFGVPLFLLDVVFRRYSTKVLLKAYGTTFLIQNHVMSS
ncbi:hypothetical protein Y032_0434g1396 [Ancylostoma ceylanicum]|uniref:Uncharacterized protein n=1 Tax=Ancylostoma ceylanicum TaxID=53326 RepID=A0A016WZJ2_9BILA|nr:hypothetical protein Y032_0434g1396 [Ancylostoma ceylanicum]